MPNPARSHRRRTNTDDGTDTSFSNLLLTLGQGYSRILCDSEGANLLLFAHNSTSQELEVWRLTPGPQAPGAAGKQITNYDAVRLTRRAADQIVGVIPHTAGEYALAYVLMAALGLSHIAFGESGDMPNDDPRSKQPDTPVLGTPCPVDAAATPATLGSSKLAGIRLSDGSSLLAYPQNGEYKIARVADPDACTGITSVMSGVPTTGGLFASSGAALLEVAANCVRLVATKMRDIQIGAAGVLTVLPAIDLPPTDSGGARDALGTGTGYPIVAGPAGASGMRMMGDAIGILADGFEG